MRNKDTTNARIAYMKMCETRLKLYNKSPKLCLYCGKPILYEKKIMGNKFCNKSCAAKYNNKLYKKRKGHGKNRYGINGKPTTTHTCKFCKNKINSRKTFCNDKCKIMYTNQKSITLIQHNIQHNKYVHRDAIRKYLLLTREYRCNSCKRTKWKNEPIPLESHHIDGNYKNNSDENLELICPNCHSLTDSYRGKNRGNGRKEYKKKRI